MYNPRLKKGLFYLIIFIFAHQASYSNPLEQMGLTPLRALYPALTGSGVVVAQPEVSEGPNAWQVNPAAVGQPQSKFRWISSGGIATTFPNGLGVESSHANGVAGNFYGIASGMAPGVSQIDSYEAGHFVGSFIDAGSQPAILAEIVNQSFTYLGQDSGAEQRFDNYAATRNVLFVSGIGNGNTPVLPPGTAYNGIGVGAFGAGSNSSVGPTADGRCKPDIVAPSGVTSYSTPYVSGAAALLVQAGNDGIGGTSTDAATDIRTLKALLLNGAVKPIGWTNHPGKPLDLRYGSGVLNVLNSVKQLSFGKQPFVEATSHIATSAHPPGINGNNIGRVGWDYNSITNTPGNRDRVHHYYFTVPSDGSAYKFTATLTWNRAANTSGINNLDLFLYNAQSGQTISLSTSLVDNVEHIFLPTLAPGRYDIQVWKSATHVSTVETYALAFEAISTEIQIQRNPNGILLSWPSYPHGFTLESASTLNPPITWNPVVGSPTITNGIYQLALPGTAPQQYYRLRQP